MSISNVLVKFDQVQKTYDGKNIIVKNLNIDIYEGEFLTMLGPSGSGKTTCLMMLAGFETPTSGSIYLNGTAINDVPPHKRNIGMVFQNYALFPHMTVYENVAFPLKLRKLSAQKLKEKVQNALTMVQLDGFAGRYPAQMSGGQQQRVALARALVFEPALVLMDEPLGALDKQLREHMQLEIKSIHKNLGITIVYVTHDQGEALTMSDRVAVFNQGIIEQIEHPQKLYEVPETPFVAGFIGENNYLEGQVIEQDNDIVSLLLDTQEEVQVYHTHTITQGKRVSLSIRPERILLATDPNTYPNAISGTIKNFIYLGDHIRVQVELERGQLVTVKVPIHKFNDQFVLDKSVYLSWDPKNAVLFDSVK